MCWPRPSLTGSACSVTMVAAPTWLARGKYSSNLLPMPGSLRTTIAPSCACMMLCATDSPSPVPLPAGLVVKKGSKIRRSVAASMPQPASLTTMRAYRPGRRLIPARARASSSVMPSTRISMLPVRPCIACAALVPTFSSTCCTWVGSATTDGVLAATPHSMRTPPGSARRSSRADSSTTEASDSTRREVGWRRPKVRICCTRSRARCPAF